MARPHEKGGGIEEVALDSHDFHWISALQNIQEAEVERLKEQLKAKAQEAVDSTKARGTIEETCF